MKKQLIKKILEAKQAEGRCRGKCCLVVKY